MSAAGQIGAAGWISGSATIQLSVAGEISEQSGLSGAASITIGATGALSGVWSAVPWRVIRIGVEVRGSQINAESRTFEI